LARPTVEEESVHPILPEGSFVGDLCGFVVISIVMLSAMNAASARASTFLKSLIACPVRSPPEVR
jgi:hypothetical protein